MAEYGRGIKAGVVSGIIYGIIFGILAAIMALIFVEEFETIYTAGAYGYEGALVTVAFIGVIIG